MNVTQAVTTLASQGPLVLIVEDLHWADPSTLELFDYLAFALTEQTYIPLLLVGTYRPTAPETRLGQFLDRIRLESVARSWTLTGLDERETRVFLQELGVKRPTQQLMQAIHGTTQGIPLFIEEAFHFLIRHGALDKQDGDWHVRTGALPSIELPQDLSHAISGRLQSLPPACLFPLMLAALLGETFDTAVLQALITLDAQDLQESLEASIEDGVLSRDGTRYRFSHPLIRHAFYNRLAPAGRRNYHLQIAQTLETLYAGNLEPHILELAHHFVQAGPLAAPQTVMTYAWQAASRAFAMYAWHDAARYYEATLTASASVKTVLAQDRANLLYQAGLSHYRNQDVAPAKDYFEQAAQAYRNIGDVRNLANTRTWLTMMSYMHNSLSMDVMANVRELQEVLEALGDVDPGLSGYVMVIIAQAYRDMGQSDKANDFAQNALHIGRQASIDFVCSAALNALGMAYLGRLQVEAAIQSWQESVQYASCIDNPLQYSLPLSNLPHALSLKGRLKEAAAQALSAGEAARLIQDWSGYSKILSHLASVSVAQGNFAAAEAYHQQTMQMAERSQYTWGGFRSLQASSCALALRGLWDEAYDALNMIIESGRLFTEPRRFQVLLVRTFRQLILMYQSENFDENITSLASELTEIVKNDTYSIAPLCAIIELGVATFNKEIIEKPATMIANAMQNGVLVSGGWIFLLPRVLGLAAVIRAEWEQAEIHFQQAFSAGKAIGARPELARTHYDYARMNLLRRDREIDFGLITEHVEIASEMLHELNMLPHAQAVSHLKQAVSGAIKN